MGKKNLILVVDDDEDIRLLLKEYLQAKGLEVVVARDGKDAIDLAARQVPDLVITDLLLPKEHGIEVMRELKDRFFTPIIAISGIYQKEEIEAKIDDIFLEGFFEKPLDLDSLFKGIQSALNE
jgi:CheY-like chemotaxis protein